MANYYYHGFRDYGRARTELAIARTPNNNAEVFEYTGYIDRREGHWEEATRNLESAVELDPRNFFTLQQLAPTYHYLRRYAAEARTLDRALAIVPGIHSPAFFGRNNTRLAGRHQALSNRAGHTDRRRSECCARRRPPELCPLRTDRRSCCSPPDEHPRDGVVTDYGVNFPHAYWEGVVALWRVTQPKRKLLLQLRAARWKRPLRNSPTSPAL